MSSCASDPATIVALEQAADGGTELHVRPSKPALLNVRGGRRKGSSVAAGGDSFSVYTDTPEEGRVMAFKGLARLECKADFVLTNQTFQTGPNF